MSLNPAKVGLAVQGGLSIVCATCTRYWEGRERNLPGSLCTSSSPCGSPLAGDDFHAYSGPITDFTRWCFMCGAEASFAIQLPESQRLFGVCERHVQALPEMRPVDMTQPAATQRADRMVVLDAAGKSRPAYKLFGLRKKTLGQLIADTEAEWDKAAAARGEER